MSCWAWVRRLTDLRITGCAAEGTAVGIHGNPTGDVSLSERARCPFQERARCLDVPTGVCCRAESAASRPVRVVDVDPRYGLRSTSCSWFSPPCWCECRVPELHRHSSTENTHMSHIHMTNLTLTMRLLLCLMPHFAFHSIPIAIL